MVQLLTMRSTGAAFILVFLILAVAVGWGDVPENPVKRSNWASLWVPRAVNTSKPQQERVESIGTLGNDLEGKEWLVISTKYNRIYYQPSIDAGKLKQVVRWVDNAYDFLKKWNPDVPETPIKTFLVPGELGKSRCCPLTNSMRTGDKGDPGMIVTSLLHEETHLFNHACLQKRKQGWWLGEFSCHYFQQRMKLETAKKDVKGYAKSKLPDGPRCSFREIAPNARERFDEAFSAMYFLHKTYGDENLYKFRVECLRQADRERYSAGDSEGAFKIAFGKDFEELDRQWRQFYGWDTIKRAKIPERNADIKEFSSIKNLSPVKLAARVVSELAGPEYQGRASGGPGEARAGEYIADLFRQIGLEPILPDGGFFQPFSVTFRNLAGPVGSQIRGQNFAYKSDYGVLRCCPGGWFEGGMYFAGFGERVEGTARQEMNKLKGKVCVAFARDKNVSNVSSVVKLAEDAGAAGVLIIDPPSLYNPREISKRHTMVNKAMPVLRLSPQTGQFILSLDQSGLENLYKQLLAGNNPRPDIAGNCRLAASIEYRERSESRNVLAGLMSPKSQKQSILLFAHYDGQGQDGEKQYYPSANDNASGVAVMLTIAAKLAARRDDLKCNVLFAALGAEEIDCKGAEKLLRSNAIDWKEVRLAICFDMVGQGRQDRLPVRTLRDDLPICLALKDYAVRNGWNVEPSIKEKFGSDAKVIKQSGAPTFYIITGGEEWHSVEDGSGNTDPKYMDRLAELLAGFIAEFEAGNDVQRSVQRVQ